MNKELIISYVYDFLSLYFEENKFKINKVILFGSVARNDFDKKSDIDLFIEPLSKESVKKIEENLRYFLKRFETIKERTWKLKDVDFPIRFIVGNLNDKKWSNLKEEIISSGILLYGQYEELPEKLQHYIMVNYSLKKLSTKTKMQLLRRLFGYKSEKNKKIYRKEGLLHQLRGYKLYSNVILVPFVNLKEIRTLFNKFKVKAEIRDVWLR